MPVRIVAWVGSGDRGKARKVASWDEVNPMAAAASAMAAARGTTQRFSSNVADIAGIATAIPSHNGGSLRRAK